MVPILGHTFAQHSGRCQRCGTVRLPYAGSGKEEAIGKFGLIKTELALASRRVKGLKRPRIPNGSLQTDQERTAWNVGTAICGELGVQLGNG